MSGVYCLYTIAVILCNYQFFTGLFGTRPNSLFNKVITIWPPRKGSQLIPSIGIFGHCLDRRNFWWIWTVSKQKYPENCSKLISRPAAYQYHVLTAPAVKLRARDTCTLSANIRIWYLTSIPVVVGRTTICHVTHCHSGAQDIGHDVYIWFGGAVGEWFKLLYHDYNLHGPALEHPLFWWSAAWHKPLKYIYFGS